MQPKQRLWHLFPQLFVPLSISTHWLENNFQSRCNRGRPVSNGVCKNHFRGCFGIQITRGEDLNAHHHTNRATKFWWIQKTYDACFTDELPDPILIGMKVHLCLCDQKNHHGEDVVNKKQTGGDSLKKRKKGKMTGNGSDRETDAGSERRVDASLVWGTKKKKESEI